MKRSRPNQPTKLTPPYASAAFLCARFWHSFVVEDEIREGMKTPCWRWTGAIGTNGYGIIQFSHATMSQRCERSNRIALMLKLGRWPTDREHACHECDFRPCVSPLHIYLGNDKTNSADRARRGRVVTSRKPGVPPANQVYTNEQIQEALDLYFGPEGNGTAKNKHNIQSLAKRFFVSEAVIRRTLRQKNKKSLTLTMEQQEEINRLYFSPDGQGSVCPAGSSQAKWTASSISKHLSIAKHSINSAILGDTFPTLYRPTWAQQYKGGVINKRLREASSDQEQ